MGSKIGNIQKEESGPRFSDPRVINDFWLARSDFTDRFGTREIRWQLAEHG